MRFVTTLATTGAGIPDDNTVSTAKLQTDAVTLAKMANAAVGVAELSASGTASSSTVLRGDNAWSSTFLNPTLTNYTESVVAIGTVTSASTLSLTNGTVQTATLTASTLCTFAMPTATAGKSFVLYAKQPAVTGSASAVFTGVKWPAGTAPTMTATAGKMDIFAFAADGTNWYGSFAQNYTY